MQDAQKLSDWLDAVEREMDKFGEVAILPEELFEQSEELAVSSLNVSHNVEDPRSFIYS